MRRCTGSNAVKANAGGHNYPDNETVTSAVEQGTGRVGGHQPVLLVPGAGAGRYGRPAFGDRILCAARRRLRPERLRGRECCARRPIKRPRSGSSLFSPRRRGRRSSPTATASSTRSLSGVTTAQPETPFAALQPNDITIAELGTGAGGNKALAGGAAVVRRAWRGIAHHRPGGRSEPIAADRGVAVLVSAVVSASGIPRRAGGADRMGRTATAAVPPSHGGACVEHGLAASWS